MGSTDGNRGIITDINVTPMVDVMLVLLVIFMVTASYITRKGIDVQLPEGATGSDLPESSVSVLLAPDGRLFIEGDEVSLDALRDRISPRVRDNPDVQVVVDGDRRVEYGRVMEVIDSLRSLGVRNFAAALEHRGEGPTPSP